MGYYALGFTMTSDRIFHMDKLRRVAQGRLSEMFGEPTIEVDKALRNLGIEPLAQKVYDNLTPQTKEMFDEFTHGVNDYLNLFSLGIEYWLLGISISNETVVWKPTDSISIYLFMMFGLSESFDIELYRDYLYYKLKDEELVEKILPIGPKYEIEGLTQLVINDEELKQNGFFKENGYNLDPKDKTRRNFEFIEDNIKEELEFVKEFKNLYSPGASNCWAVSGKHTKSGKPMLVNDPHLKPAIPSSFYLTEVAFNDEFMIGAAIPGTPIMVSGRNKHMAFGPTALNSDTLDLYEEKIENGKYLFKGEWKDLKVRNEVIKVRDGKDEVIHIRETHHGPVLDYVGSALSHIMPQFPPLMPKTTLSMNWIGNYAEKDTFLEVLRNSYKYKLVQDFINDSKGKSLSNFGVCLADSAGNIAVMPIVMYPKRKCEDASSRGIKEGWTGDHEWEGFVEKNLIPHSMNPDKGYIFTSNGRMSSLNVEAGVGVGQLSNARAFRINQLLHDYIHIKNRKLDADDMRRILGDVYDVYAAVKLPIMLKLVKQPGLLEKHIKNEKVLKYAKKWIASLEKWNYKFTVDSIDATIFALWEISFIDGFFKNEIPDFKLRNHKDRYLISDIFYTNTLKDLEKDQSYLSKYCQVGDSKEENACVGNLARGFEFVFKFLSEEGYESDEKVARYGNLHTVQYSHSPFSSTALKFLFHRSDEDSGSKNTINVGGIYLGNFETNGLEVYQSPNYRMIVDFGNDSENFYSLENGISENILLNYFYYNLHESHFNLNMIPMNFDSLKTTQMKRWSTMRFIYKNWFVEREAELKKLEELKNQQDDAKEGDL